MIELHPVLAITFGKSNIKPPPPPRASPTPGRGGGFSVTAWVTPNPMPYDAYPTLHARTLPGARCGASVVYSTGRRPVSFDGSPRTVGSTGVVTWTWHEETSGTGGAASVACSYKGQKKSATAVFSVR